MDRRNRPIWRHCRIPNSGTTRTGFLVTKIISAGLPYGGSWTFELDSADENKSRLKITENGEVYNPIFRFASRFIIGHTATIDKYSQALKARLETTLNEVD